MTEQHDDHTCRRRHRIWAAAHPPMSCPVGCTCSCHEEDTAMRVEGPATQHTPGEQ